MRTILSITKSISDQNRIRILCALSRSGELCVCQIQELLGLAPSSTSKHLSLLAAAGLIEVRKDGRWAYYRIAEEAEMLEGAEGVIEWLCNQSAKEKVIEADVLRLNQILSYSPEELCQRQTSGKSCC